MKIRQPVTSAASLVGFAVSAASLGLYLSTLAPTLTWGYRNIGVDGGELLAAANTLGIPHPPGYPTYTLLLKFFATVFPVGDFAFRGNLLSAVLASGSIGLLYLVTLRVCRYLRPESPEAFPIVGAALGATVLAVSPLFWSQSVITEVYTLNALFVGALLLVASRLALRLPSEPPVRPRSITRMMALFAFTLGIGLGNHLTLLAVAIPLLAWLWAALGWRKLVSAWAVGAFVLGLMVYLYLPIRAAQHPPVNWGDADTFGGMLWMLSGRVYQDYVFGVPAGSIFDRFIIWVELTFVQLNPLGIFIGLMGCAALYSGERRFLATSLLSIIVITVYSITYNSVDPEVLTIPAFYLFSIWVGAGFLSILSIFSVAVSGATGPFNTLKLGGFGFTTLKVAAVLTVIAFGAMPVTSIILNYSSQDLRTNRVAYEHAVDILDSVPDGSVLISAQEATVFSLWYLRYATETDRDFAPIAAPLLQFDWYWRDISMRYPDRFKFEVPANLENALKDIVEHNYGHSRVLFTYTDQFLEEVFNMEQLGNLYEASPKPTP